MNSININSLVRENVKRLKPYSSARDEFTGSASVYLDANENPFNTDYNRYPDPHQVSLKKRIAVIKKIRPEQLFLGNGSDEPIDLLLRAFCEPGRDNVLIPQPTYGMYSVSAAINDIEIKAVNLTKDFDLDVTAIKNAWNQNTKLLFLCSPNNPSGNLLDAEKIKSLLLQFHGLVILDEAYIDFTGTPGFLPVLDEFSNLVVLQTFSKAWGLAGIRLGMCFSNPEVIQVLDKIKPPYNINSMTQAVALDYLRDENRKNSWVANIKAQRDVLKANLLTVPIVQKVYPSDANFLLVRVSDAQKTYHDLVDRGIIVRDRSNVVLCEDSLRITVGTEIENRKLIDVLKQL
jgi:histidinol-phosphate aminotransferase